MPPSKAPLARCWECPLEKAKCAPTSGPVETATIALVSRSPGQHDVHNGAPFTGPSGEVVDYLLNKYRVKRENVILTNVVLCETESPSKEAIAACSSRLDAEIESVKTIIAGGSEAILALTGKRSVHSARGVVHKRTSVVSTGTALSKIIEQRVIATNNPALVLRESDSFPNLVSDFRLALDPLPNPKFPQVEVINDASVARNILREWSKSKHGIIATDLEWAGNNIYCAGFSYDGKQSTVFGRNVILDSECFGFIKQLYESEQIMACWHNGKSDTSVLWRNGIEARVSHDTLLISYALDEEPGRHSLDYLLQTEFGWPDYTPASVNHFKKTGKLDYYGIEPEQMLKAEYELYEYNGWDAAGTYQLYVVLSQRAKDFEVWERPYMETLLPASDAFRTVELHGFRFDAEGSANTMESYVLPRLEKLREGMRSKSGVALLNPRSTDQMANLYYDRWGLRHALRDKAKQKFSRSTGKEVREEIDGGRFYCNPAFTEILSEFAGLHRSFAKIERQRSNYFQSLIERVDEFGYIHPWFNLAGTATGRTSSTEPNFQNITREGVEGIPSVRTLFLPTDGNLLIQADYSQAELRGCAYLSGEEGLLSIYRDGTRSLHRERAAAFYGEDYTKEQYVKSKNINFGVTYGQSAAAFAQMYHMPREEAQAYIDSWWRQFPTLQAWTKEVRKQALTGEVIAPMGYRRRFHLITRENIEEIQREAVNFIPQNTAAAFTIRALTELVKEYQVPIVNTVHDSIVADVPEDEVMEVGALMKKVMEKQAKEILGWDLPFTVDIAIGETWATVEEVDVN